MIEGSGLRKLAEDASRCAILHAEGTTIYRHDGKGADLFEHRFPGITDLIRVVDRSNEWEMQENLEIAAGTPGVLDLFIKLKARLSAAGTQTARTRDTIEDALTKPMKMALAERNDLQLRW